MNKEQAILVGVALFSLIVVGYIVYLIGPTKIKHAASEYGLELLLVLIGLGNAETLHQYLVTTGSPNTWQLIVAIYATELLIVFATLWGLVGLCISLAMFMVSLISIKSVYAKDWVGHSYFSISLFAGAVGNFFRRGGGFNAIKRKVNNGTIVPNLAKALFTIEDIKAIPQMTIADIKAKFGLSMASANILRQMSLAGDVIDNDVIVSLQ